MARSTKKATKGNPVALLITARRPDSLGTHSIDVVPCERAHDDMEHRDYPRTPETIDGMRMRDLTLRVYRHNRQENRGAPQPLDPSCTRPAFTGYQILDAEDVKAMAATFTKLGKRLEEQRDRYGYTRDFAETVLRFAAAIGAEFIAFDAELFTTIVGDLAKTHREDLAHARWEWMEVGRARPYLDLVRDIDLPKPAGEEAAS